MSIQCPDVSTEFPRGRTMRLEAGRPVETVAMELELAISPSSPRPSCPPASLSLREQAKRHRLSSWNLE